MRRCALPLLLLSLPCFNSPVAAQQPKPLTPEALLSLRHLSALEFSPDGSRVAFVIAEPAKGDQHPGHIWLFETSAGDFRQLTYSDKSAWNKPGMKTYYDLGKRSTISRNTTPSTGKATHLSLWDTTTLRKG